jgi:hydrogenase maturation protein HypF
MPLPPPDPNRLKLVIRGGVQGVGFRPFIFRLANDLSLKGWVNNSPQGVFLEVEGPQPRLEEFRLRLQNEKPPRSFIQSLESSWLDAVGYSTFEIRQSDSTGAKTALVLPDIVTCPDCLQEVFDPKDRRYFYPFTNCTNCGPRFSIIQSLPYDRTNTSMKQFTMCQQCKAEYDDPHNRRFHAQPNACPVCGPHLEIWDRTGAIVAGGPDSKPSLEFAAEAIGAGKILAVKGLGGFHLVVPAHDDAAIQRLRALKHREEKPFALMFPSLEAIKGVCDTSPPEEQLLRSPEGPLVLLRRLKHPIATKPNAKCIAGCVAPNNPNLAAMLPSNPLYHLLMSLVDFPVVATSGNLSDEPICTGEHEALDRLGNIADLFLVHNRPIVRHVDDSIVRVIAGREMVLRRARGFAPLPIQLPHEDNANPCVLAVGAHLKNTVALGVGPQIFVSQHIGDLETDQAYQAFTGVISDFQALYQTSPAVVATDAHPDYLSTRFASQCAAQMPSRPKVVSVQHHLAHVLSCMGENELEPPLLGVSWDGTGYGLDGTIWGGEFFLVEEKSWSRVAHFRQFRLPGGDKAVKEPRRTALGVLSELFGEEAFAQDLTPIRTFSPGELASLKTMLRRHVNSPLTSSAGRLFDAVASLLGIRQTVRFEGQAAMELEFALPETIITEAYPFPVLRFRPGEKHVLSRTTLSVQSPLSLDWSPMVEAILDDLKHRTHASHISAKFHNALVEGIISIAKQTDHERVLLSGGCFQNRYLAERSIARLREEGFRPYWHQRIPPNDGGISLGQVLAAFSPREQRLIQHPADSRQPV